MNGRRFLVAVVCSCQFYVAAQDAESAAQPFIIVTLGDSITKGVRTGVADKETFAALTQTMLQKSGLDCRVVNVGIGGERTDQALNRLDDVIILSPRLVTVMYGTNDSYVDPGQLDSRITVDEYSDNLKQIVSRLLVAGIEPVLLTSPRWAADAGPNGVGENPNVRLEPYVDACRKVAEQLGVRLIDQFAHWTRAESDGTNLDDWTTDGCHPNPEGHRQLATVMRPVLLSVLRSQDIRDDDARRRASIEATSVPRVRSVAQQQPGTPKAAQHLVTGTEPVSVICFGDSVTGLYYHSGGRRAYTDVLGIALRRLCPRANVTTINAGISGNTTRNALARIDTDVLAQNPSVVTVMFGLNDIVGVPVDEYRANLLTIIDKAHTAGAEIVLCTPNSVVTTASRPADKLEQYCDVVREVACEQQVTLCDCYAAYHSLRERDAKAWRLLMSDEIHPNFDGHKRIAEQIARTITGREISLRNVAPLRPVLPLTMSKLRSGESIKVLAMPPFDQSIAESLRKLSPDANVDVVAWSIESKSFPLLAEDAKMRVRSLQPDLVLIAPPGSEAAESREEFIHSFAWLLNWSLSFGRLEWDAVVIHPDVNEPQDSPGEFDGVLRQLVGAQDLTLIDRPHDSTADATEIFDSWLRREWNSVPTP